MFQFPWYASDELCIHSKVTIHYDSWVLTAPRSISLFVASFIGSWRLGILRAHLLA